MQLQYGCSAITFGMLPPLAAPALLLHQPELCRLHATLQGPLGDKPGSCQSDPNNRTIVIMISTRLCRTYIITFAAVTFNVYICTIHGVCAASANVKRT